MGVHGILCIWENKQSWLLVPFRRGEKADGVVHPASLIVCCRQCCQRYGYLQDWHLAPQSALPRTSQISRSWVFSQSGPGPPAMQISQNLLSNPVMSQSRAHSLGVNGVLRTSVDGAGYPWGNSLAISWPWQGLSQDTKGEEWNYTVLFYTDCDFRSDN